MRSRPYPFMLYPLCTLSLALAEADTASRFGGTAGPDLTRYFVVCAILIVVTGLVAWGFKRLLSGNLSSRAAKRSLQTLDVLPLGGKRKLAVVRCYDRTFVLGLGDHEITPIAELDAADTADSLVPVPSKASGAAFATALEVVRNAAAGGPGPRAQEAMVDAQEAGHDNSQPAKRIVRRKVKKNGAPKVAKQVQAASVAAAQQIVLEKQRERKSREHQQTIPAQPPRTEAAEPREFPRLDGVLG